MDSALLVHRLHFAFTATFHYLFPQLTMGLALLIVVLKTIGLRRNDPVYHEAARFWGKDFWHQFRPRCCDRHSDGIPVRHQLVALFAIRGRRHRPDPGHGGHVCLLPGIGVPRIIPLRRKAVEPESALAVGGRSLCGSWLSGYFIIATDAFMQHPVGYFTALTGACSWRASGISCSIPGPDGNTRIT
jgi:cytochrome bd ubiquinol oxidase subunit I